MSTLTTHPWWINHFLPASPKQGIDFVSKDGTIIVEVKESNQGLAAFHAGIMQLAMALDQKPAIRRAYLVYITNKLSQDRVISEWQTIKKLMTPGISRRLYLVGFISGVKCIEPDDSDARQMASVFEKTSLVNQLDTSNRMIRAVVGQRRYTETLKVLLVRWLRQEGPISIGELADTVGCSYPTLQVNLTKIENRKYLIRQKGRKVELSQFPETLWRELLGMSTSIRRSISFQDTSGGRPNPFKLHDRLRLKKPTNVAIGGVLAARHWQARFNLNGTPRLDLIVHVQDLFVDLSFVNQLDPALKETDDREAAPLLVVHLLQRAKSLFTEKPHDLPFADPVETALDLVDMGLTQQANDLFHHLRKEVRLA